MGDGPRRQGLVQHEVLWYVVSGAVRCGGRYAVRGLCLAAFCAPVQRADSGRLGQTEPLGDGGMSRFFRRSDEVTCHPRTGSLWDLGQRGRLRPQKTRPPNPDSLAHSLTAGCTALQRTSMAAAARLVWFASRWGAPGAHPGPLPGAWPFVFPERAEIGRGQTRLERIGEDWRRLGRHQSGYVPRMKIVRVRIAQ